MGFIEGIMVIASAVIPYLLTSDMNSAILGGIFMLGFLSKGDN